jgi:acyl dehydratase
MAYAASLNDQNPLYFDTTAGSVMAHPLFPVCLEWPSILATRGLTGTELTSAESARGVHAAHDLHMFKPIQSETTLRTRATLIGVESIKPGAGYTLRLDTIDEAEDLVCQTYQYGIYRDVAVTGNKPQATPTPKLPVVKPLNDEVINIPVGGRHGAYLHRMRTYLESDPHGSAIRSKRRATRHYFAWHSNDGFSA